MTFSPVFQCEGQSVVFDMTGNIAQPQVQVQPDAGPPLCHNLILLLEFKGNVCSLYLKTDDNM